MKKPKTIYAWPPLYLERERTINRDGDIVVYGEGYPSHSFWIVPGTYVE